MLRDDLGRSPSASWKRTGRSGPNIYFTGDGAKRDEDGYFWVLGRVDDVVNVAGPSHRHDGGGKRARRSSQRWPKRLSSATPHELKGQAIFAFVILKEGFAAAAELAAELKEHVVTKIGSIARPEDVLFAADLPKTRSGKIMRRLLKRYRGGEGARRHDDAGRSSGGGETEGEISGRRELTAWVAAGAARPDVQDVGVAIVLDDKPGNMERLAAGARGFELALCDQLGDDLRRAVQVARGVLHRQVGRRQCHRLHAVAPERFRAPHRVVRFQQHPLGVNGSPTDPCPVTSEALTVTRTRSSVS